MYPILKSTIVPPATLNPRAPVPLVNLPFRPHRKCPCDMYEYLTIHRLTVPIISTTLYRMMPDAN